MVGKVVGYERQAYTKKDTGEHKVGFNIHVLCKPPKNVEFHGEKTKEIYASELLLRNTIGSVELGKSYNFDFEQNGKFVSLIDIVPVSDLGK